MSLLMRAIAGWVYTGLACGFLVSCSGPGGKALFDGRTLAGWAVVDFPDHGEAFVTPEGWLQVEMGPGLSGVVYTGDVPRVDYEVSLEARRVEGSDFFCGLTVPVEDSFCTLVVGGWGGSVVGISSINGLDASENDTRRTVRFETGRWYRIQMRITADRLSAWIDDRLVIAADIAGRRVSLRPGLISMGTPLSLTTYATTAQFRNIRLRRVSSSGGFLQK